MTLQSVNTLDDISQWEQVWPVHKGQDYPMEHLSLLVMD